VKVRIETRGLRISWERLRASFRQARSSFGFAAEAAGARGARRRRLGRTRCRDRGIAGPALGESRELAARVAGGIDRQLARKGRLEQARDRLVVGRERVFVALARGGRRAVRRRRDRAARGARVREAQVRCLDRIVCRAGERRSQHGIELRALAPPGLGGEGLERARGEAPSRGADLAREGARRRGGDMRDLAALRIERGAPRRRAARRPVRGRLRVDPRGRRDRRSRSSAAGRGRRRRRAVSRGGSTRRGARCAVRERASISSSQTVRIVVPVRARVASSRAASASRSTISRASMRSSPLRPPRARSAWRPASERPLPGRPRSSSGNAARAGSRGAGESGHGGRPEPGFEALGGPRAPVGARRRTADCAARAPPRSRCAGRGDPEDGRAGRRRPPGRRGGSRPVGTRHRRGSSAARARAVRRRARTRARARNLSAGRGRSRRALRRRGKSAEEGAPLAVRAGSSPVARRRAARACGLR
jgi:hypothetical protein